MECRKALQHDPSQRGQDFVSKRSILDCPKTVDVVSIRSADNSLLGGNKEQFMELLRDRVLTPRNYEGIDFLSYFSKAEWSVVRLKDGPLRTPRCVLATLTSTFQLVIHGQLNELTDEHQRNWTPLLNVSQTANMILRQKWEIEDEEQTGGLEFDTYKKRMRQLTCVDFTWMSALDGDNSGRASELYMIVAHFDGVIDIWKIFTCVETGKLVGEIICSKMVMEGHVISTMKFQVMDSNVGILAIGTNNGIVRMFRIERQTAEALESERDAETAIERNNMFRIEDGIEIWSDDELQVESFMFSFGSEPRNILKRLSVDVLFHKHPSFLCSSTISMFGDVLSWKPVTHIKLSNGPIVGLGRYSDELLMCCHESGLLSLIYHKNGDLKYLEGSANSIKDGPPSKADIYRYKGFAFSTNKGLAFIGKNLNCFYDHNVDKDPGKLLVFSTLSVEHSWDTVKEHFRANGCRLDLIADVLLAFRYQLRSRNHMDVSKFLDGSAGSLEITPEILQLYLWTLRALNVTGEQQIGEDAERIKKMETIHHRQQEVEDELLQRHYITLLESIDETMLPTLSLPEAQSLFLIQQFLNTKPSLRHISFEPAIIPAEAPSCTICDSEVDFVEHGTTHEEDSVGSMQPGKIAGCNWYKQQCTEGHNVPVCILSLLPCKFPYRSCETCQVICCLKPVFNLKTECLLCGDEMVPSHDFEEVEADGEEENSDLEDPPGIRFLGVKSERSETLN